jgi:hypothetical protein
VSAPHTRRPETVRTREIRFTTVGRERVVSALCACQDPFCVWVLEAGNWEQRARVYLPPVADADADADAD